MFNDILIVISWWVVWFFLGIVSLPLVRVWLGPVLHKGQGLWDQGYSQSKLVGLLVIGYIVWLGASLGIWSFNRQVLWLVLFGWIGINIWFLRNENRKIEFIDAFKNQWRLWLRLELLFLAATIFWSLIRAHQPDINGLEKFMDFGFMQSILNSSYFPPHDMWFAGGDINYYYFGHYLSAVMTLLSGIKSAIAYNLMMATLFSLAVSGAVAVGGSIIKNQISNITDQSYSSKYILVGGLLTAFLLAVRGNLHLVSYYINKWFEFNTSLLPSVENPYWYPDATRYIPFTIHEFPMYSYVVADLHAHVINLPLVLLFLSGVVVVVSRFRRFDVNFNGKVSRVNKLKAAAEKLLKISYSKHVIKISDGWYIRWWEVIIWGGLLGVFMMTNAWDVPIYGLLIGVTLFILALLGEKLVWIDDWKRLLEIITKLIWIGITLIGLSLIVSFPFQLNFEQIAKGVFAVGATSEISKLLVLWGWDIFLFLSLLIFVIGNIKNQKLSFKKIVVWDLVILEWYLVGWLLILIPEFIYVKDIYIEDYHRANTMFKLVYQSWTIFAVCGSYTIVRLLASSWKYFGFKFKNNFLGLNYVFYGWMILIVMGLISIGAYPKFAIDGYYNGLKEYKGMDGEAWLMNKYPDDYAGIQWLRGLDFTGEPPVVLEAVGDSYTEFNRVSAYTGYPTIEGWLVHEWLWRGSYDEPGARATEVSNVYTFTDIDEVMKVLSKYRVDYVFVGDKEREKYPNLYEDSFKELGQVVFESGETRIYKVDSI